MKRILVALLVSTTLLADEAVVLPEADPGEPPIGTTSIISSDDAKNRSIAIGASITTVVAITAILVATLSTHGKAPSSATAHSS